MRRYYRTSALLLVAVLVFGCGPDASTDQASGPAASPSATAAVKPARPDVVASDRAADTTASEVALVSPEQLRERIAGDKGKAVLVDFWATWCGPCREAYPHTVALSNKHADDLVVYSVSMDETDEASASAVKDALASFPKGNIRALQSAQGGAEEAYTAFEITGGALPHYKVFDREGNVVETFGGKVDETVEPEKIDAAVEKAIGS